MPIGVKVMKKANARICCIIAGSIIAALLYLASYTQSFSSFALVFGILIGLTIGFMYMIPVAHNYKYFPKKKGMVSGIVIAGSGLGTFIFSMLASSTINPNNFKTNDYYPVEIAGNVPNFLRQFAVIVFAASIIGSLLLLELLPGMDPYAEAHKNDHHEP